MTVRYANVSLGTTSTKDGSSPITSKSTGAAQAGHVSIAYDDATITYVGQLVAGVREALAHALGNASLKQ
jgi:hypothetical protein